MSSELKVRTQIIFFRSEGLKKHDCFARDGNVLADARCYSLTMFFCLTVPTELLDCAPHDYAWSYDEGFGLIREGYLIHCELFLSPIQYALNYSYSPFIANLHRLDTGRYETMELAFKKKVFSKYRHITKHLEKLLSPAVAHKSVQIAFCVVWYFINLLNLGLQKSVKNVIQIAVYSVLICRILKAS